MAVLLNTFQLSFTTVLTIMNSAIGLLLSISMFGFPLLGWAAAAAVIAGLVSLLGGADDDDDEMDFNAEYRFAPDDEEYEDESIPALAVSSNEDLLEIEEAIKAEMPRYIERRKAAIRARTIKRVAAARVRNKERGGKRYD